MKKNNNEFNNLVDLVVKRRIRYIDYFEIAAYIESIGWNDDRAFQVFGTENIFELAEQIFEVVQHKASVSTYAPKRKIGFFIILYNLIKDFLRGLIFALPMAISVIAMLTLRFSLWSYEGLSTELATSIAIGTILSFMTVGGFTQAIARRGFFYIIIGHYNIARRITFTFIRTGYVTIFIVAILMVLSCTIFQYLPMEMLIIAVSYYLFLSSIWLSVTVMYILRKELTFTGLIILGILLVFFFFIIMGYDIIIAQLISLFIVTVIGILLVIYFFKSAEMRLERGIAVKPPKLSITFYTVLPYFIYGFLYFTFLYTDRVIAWSTYNENFMPYIIWFRGPYELGMDFALFTLMIPMGIIEVVVGSVMKRIEVEQHNYSGNKIGEMNSYFKRMYKKSLVGISLLSVFSAAAIYCILRYIDANYSVFLRFKIFDDPTIHFVLVCALIAYSLISISLMNAVLMFSLSQPQPINKVILKALLINIILGFVASRWYSWWVNNAKTRLFGIESYAFAVLGVIAGSIFFLVASTRAVFTVLNKLDYYLYTVS